MEGYVRKHNPCFVLYFEPLDLPVKEEIRRTSSPTGFREILICTHWIDLCWLWRSKSAQKDSWFLINLGSDLTIIHFYSTAYNLDFLLHVGVWVKNGIILKENSQIHFVTGMFLSDPHPSEQKRSSP